jgi:hypothetical protein
VTEEAAASIGIFKRPAISEPRWPSVLAVLFALALYVSLPQEMATHAGVATALRYVIPAVEVLMLLQSWISIVTVVLVAARAVNMLG